MNISKHKCIAKILLCLWVLSFCLVSCIAAEYLETQKQFGATDPLTLFSSYQYVVMLFVSLYSCPMLYVTYLHARKGGMKKTSLFARIILIQHTIWLFLLIFEMIATTIC